MQRTIVLNALGGPGSGKSTLAFGLMSLLKSRGEKAEFVSEHAKELTYRRDWAALANQDAVTREQDRRIRELIGLVDFVVTDTAIPMGIVYADPTEFGDWFRSRCWQLHDSYTSFTVFVRRMKSYQTYGRKETEEEARRKDQEILDLFGPERIHYTVDGTEGAAEEVYAALMKFRDEIYA